jgi:hypothetical protein
MKTRADEIKEKFIEYHKNNPWVWELFERFAMEMIGAGRERYSSSAIIERIRWEVDRKSSPDERFKISNDFRAYYARMFIAKYPMCNSFFLIKKLRSQDSEAIGEQREMFVDERGPENEESLMAELRALIGDDDGMV